MEVEWLKKKLPPSIEAKRQMVEPNHPDLSLRRQCHHIVWRVYGGGDGGNNRVLLHPTCHKQVHSRGLQVEKPRLIWQGVGKA